MSSASDHGGDYAPNFDLTGAVMLVTGPARGLGRASTLACAAAGADIVLGLRDLSTDGGLAAEIEGLGRKVLPLQLDVTRMDQIRDGVARALDRFGRIDILLNNVGVGPENPAEKVMEADFDFTVNANLKGTFFVTQAVGRSMIQRKKGRIINMSSQAGSVVLHGESIYCMTKAAINHLTRCLASEWAPYGITVNSIAPTFINTDGTAPALSDPDFKRRTLAHIPLGRIGDPKDVAAAIVFLASPAASLITGTNLLVDGGWSVADMRSAL
ncbi:SDR family NAD(P)-dependent oxidoreductase [Dongia deserti]|uniref:SDR family NAD(P)-dependent oxidoreductase n=1 Tax=Dongia deserti TaxID=2268030 RepID=UPI000E646A52|nr:glucose 1-dehydrogenase [Dongia deserti]